MKKYLEYKDEKNHKFWQIEDLETSFTVTYGKVGSKGQSKTKEFDNEDDMLDARAELIDQKLKKGYKSSTTILVEKWDDELQKIINESAKNSPESIEKVKEWLTNYFTFHLEFKIAKDELDKLDKQKIQEILKMLQKQYYEEYIAVLFPSHKINAAIEEENKSNTTYLEYKDEKSHKFWKVEVEESSFTVNFGKVGTKGEVRLFEFLDNKQIVPQVEKLINQKLKKGYQEVAIPQEKPKTEKSKTKKAKKSNSNEIDYFEELVKFNEEHGGETYAQSFCIIDDEEDFFESWLDEVSEEKAKEYSDALEIFASADGTGACYAFWFTDGNTDKNKVPIIYYGSEGEIVVVAENIKDLIKMLSFGAECMDGSFSHYIDDEDDFYEEFLEFMPNHLVFREWMKNTLNIEPVSLDGLINDDEEESEEIEVLQDKARKNVKKSFDEWQYQFYPNLEDE